MNGVCIINVRRHSASPIMKRIFICGVVLSVLSATAQASSAIYTLSGTGTGSLDAIPFSDVAFTITSTADTTNIVLGTPFGFWVVPDFATTISVSGIGSATFTIPTETFINFEVGATGITAPDQHIDILGIKNAAFFSYDLNSPQGYTLSSSVSQVTGPSYIPSPSLGFTFETTAGVFYMSSVSSVSYQADVVPEPSICALLSMGLIGLTFLGRVHKTCFQQWQRRYALVEA